MAEPKKGGARRAAPQETRLDETADAASTNAPGDAPHDTTDPSERATTVVPDFAAAAEKGDPTVNAAVPLPEAEKVDEPNREDRVEEYDTVGPNGKVVHVRHNIDTGESEVS